MAQRMMIKVGKMRRKNDSSVRVGRTIAQEWEKQESESERLAARKKARSKKIIKVLSFVAVIGVIGGIAVTEISIWVKNREKAEAEKAIIEPTVEIIDEAGTGVTSRLKQYVGQIEQDFSDIGYSLNRAVIPAGKMREIDLFLNGVDYYFKVSIDRDTAVSAEDAKRMIDYLKEKDIHPEYVDVRVKGKGYYK